MMPIRPPKLILLIGLLTSACGLPTGAPASDDTKVRADLGYDVVAPSPSQLAAVAVSAPSGQWCSGALVSPQVVLTGSHCSDHYSGPWKGTVYFPREDGVVGEVVDGLAYVRTTLQARTTEVWALGSEGGPRADDLALVRLAEPVEWPQLDIADVYPEPEPPEKLELLGYGRAGSGPDCLEDEPPLIRLRGAKETWPLGDDADGEPSACKGDSGGPVLDADRRIVAVTSAILTDRLSGERRIAVADPVLHREALFEKIEAWSVPGTPDR